MISQLKSENDALDQRKLERILVSLSNRVAKLEARLSRANHKIELLTHKYNSVIKSQQ